MKEAVMLVVDDIRARVNKVPSATDIHVHSGDYDGSREGALQAFRHLDSWLTVARLFLHRYLNRCFRIVTGKIRSGELDMTILHSCASHMKKNAKSNVETGSEDMTLKFKQIKVVDPNVAEHIAESARLNAGIRVRAGTKIRLELNWYHASGVDFWVSVYMKKKKGNILAKNQRRPSESERRAGARPQKLGRRVAGMQKPIGQQLQVRQAPEAEQRSVHTYNSSQTTDYLEQNAPTLYNIIANLTFPQYDRETERHPNPESHWYECTPKVSVGSHKGICGEEENLLPDMVWESEWRDNDNTQLLSIVTDARHAQRRNSHRSGRPTPTVASHSAPANNFDPCDNTVDNSVNEKDPCSSCDVSFLQDSINKLENCLAIQIQIQHGVPPGHTCGQHVKVSQNDDKIEKKENPDKCQESAENSNLQPDGYCSFDSVVTYKLPYKESESMRTQPAGALGKSSPCPRSSWMSILRGTRYLQEMEDIGAQFERMPNDEWLGKAWLVHGSYRQCGAGHPGDPPRLPKLHDSRGRAEVSWGGAGREPRAYGARGPLQQVITNKMDVSFMDPSACVVVSGLPDRANSQQLRKQFGTVEGGSGIRQLVTFSKLGAALIELKTPEDAADVLRNEALLEVRGLSAVFPSWWKQGNLGGRNRRPCLIGFPLVFDWTPFVWSGVEKQVSKDIAAFVKSHGKARAVGGPMRSDPRPQFRRAPYLYPTQSRGRRRSYRRGPQPGDRCFSCNQEGHCRVAVGPREAGDAAAVVKPGEEPKPIGAHRFVLESSEFDIPGAALFARTPRAGMGTTVRNRRSHFYAAVMHAAHAVENLLERNVLCFTHVSAVSQQPGTLVHLPVFRCRKIDRKVGLQIRHSGGGSRYGPSRADFDGGRC
ncbi:Casp10p [Branchiostoma belcheri]|nr:Casp10p [Branchiostoma belcheri]